MKKQWIETGQIVSTHGLHGDVKILPWADSPEFLLEFETVYLAGKAFRVQRASVQKSCVLMKLEGIDDVEAAAALRDAVVSVNRDDCELEEGAVFIADLLELPVFADERQIGVLSEVIPMPGQDVLVVKGEHTYMIPSVPEFVLERNIDEGFIRVKLIEGMQTDAL